MQGKYCKDEMDGNGPGRLRVYPFVAAESIPEQTVWPAYVEAVFSEEHEEWCVYVNIAIDGALKRDSSDRITGAIARCWEWIDGKGWEKEKADAKEKLFAQNDELCRRFDEAETPEELERAQEALALNEAILIGSGAVSFGEPFADLED